MMTCLPEDLEAEETMFQHAITESLAEPPTEDALPRFVYTCHYENYVWAGV